MHGSEQLMARASRVIPGGVNSPVRAFNGVGGTPIFFESGKGAYVFDQAGRQYIDYVGSWGPLILGHAHPRILEVVAATAAKGLSFGAPTELEVQLAELITAKMPSMDQVRMVSSGTEATMSAIRLARGFTGRDRIIKFGGCYHGHVDSLLVSAGSGALTLGVPSSPGIPRALTELTTVVPYNDAQALRDAFAQHGDSIACVIVEPVAGNMNLIEPLPEFLSTLIQCCEQYGSLSIFDEVMTGFRVHPGGAQALYGFKPDLTCLGKVIGGGMPVGAFGGRRDIMQALAPVGPVYQAGTLSGNPLAMAVGLATLELLQSAELYERLFAHTAEFVTLMVEAANNAGLPMVGRSVGSMFGLFVAEQLPTCYDEVVACDTKLFAHMFHALCEQGVYLAPSAFEGGFMSIAHDQQVLTQTRQAAQRAFAQVAQSRKA